MNTNDQYEDDDLYADETAEERAFRLACDAEADEVEERLAILGDRKVDEDPAIDRERWDLSDRLNYLADHCTIRESPKMSETEVQLAWLDIFRHRRV
jgi:hypothetical protein